MSVAKYSLPSRVCLPVMSPMNTMLEVLEVLEVLEGAPA
jgi:hypothetical protein